MPIADVKVEKQASPEAAEPIKQAITIIEHKVRNLDKRKRKIEIYREDQKNGQTLNVDQLLAVSKYGEVTKTLDFAHELCKQLSVLAVDTNKQAKKQARKELNERATQEAARIRGILLIQDVLQNMGHESVREDFLAGRRGAVQLSETDLRHLDDLYVEVSPKRVATEDGIPTFMDQVTSASEHLLALVDGKAKEVAGTTHEHLKSLIDKIQGSGYLDLHVPHAAEAATEEAIPLDAGATPSEQVEDVTPEHLSVTSDSPCCIELKECKAQTVIPSAPLAASLPIPSSLVTPPPPPGGGLGGAGGIPAPPGAAVNSSYFSTEASSNFISRVPHQTVTELIQQTVGGSFNFFQDSELDAEVGMLPPPVGATILGQIPSQTFTNQSSAAAPAAVASGPQLIQLYPVEQPFPGTTSRPPPPIPMPPAHQASTGPYQLPAQPATDYNQEPKLQAAVDVMRGKSDSWAMSDPDDPANDAASEWTQPPEHSADWIQDQGPRDWVQHMAEENATSFPAQGPARPYSGSSGGSSGNRSHRVSRPAGAAAGGTAAGGTAAGPARSTHYANPRSGARPGGGQQNGNRNSYGPPRNADNSGGTVGNGSGGFYPQQNGYQRDSFQSNGNFGGQGQNFKPARPSRDRGPPGSRGGSARGGLRGSPSNTGDAGMNPRNTQRGGACVPPRPQNNRQ